MTLPARNLTGQRFGRWTVLGEGRSIQRIRGDQKRGFKNRLICQCDCGTLREVDLVSLTRGRSTNCGCSRKKPIPVTPTLHGTSLYVIEPKGRLVLPPPLRQPLIGLVAAPRQSVLIFPAAILSVLAARWPAEFTATAHLAPVRASRVLLPRHLRAWANLWPGCEVAVSGLGETALVQRAEAFDHRLGVVMEGLYQTWIRGVMR